MFFCAKPAVDAKPAEEAAAKEEVKEETKDEGNKGGKGETPKVDPNSDPKNKILYGFAAMIPLSILASKAT